MKKILIGFLWFIGLWLGALMLGGGIVGSLAASGAENAEAAVAISEKAGEQFGIRYSGIILIGSLIASVVGTWMGILPGTRKKVEGQSPGDKA